MPSLLPEILTPGTVLLVGKGRKVTLVGTSKKDGYGLKLFRLRHHAYKDGHWRMPAHTSKETYSRDDLQEDGYVLAGEEEDAS